MDGSAPRISLKGFAYQPVSRFGPEVWQGMTADRLSPSIAPDYLWDPAGPEAKPHTDGYDQFGWLHQDRRLVTPKPAVVKLTDVSVLRRSLGRNRYHIVLDEGVCARDSYHDGLWLGRHIGETVSLETTGGPRLTVNLMDDAPIDARVKQPAILVSHFWAENYAHTLLETASRFWPIESADTLNDLPVVWDTPNRWQREIGEILALGRVKPLPHNHVLFDTLYVPSFGISRRSVRWLRKRFGAPSEPGKRRIYVSRADATERRVVNENEILDVLKPMGFEAVMLTGMTVAEQQNLFRDTAIAVMPHGAGCANMIFAAEGAKLVELVPKSYQHHMFGHIAKWSGQWYGRIVCDDGENKDMAVDPVVLSSALGAAGL